MPQFRSSSNGDLYVQYTVVFPSAIDDSTKLGKNKFNVYHFFNNLISNFLFFFFKKKSGLKDLFKHTDTSNTQNIHKKVEL